MRWFLTDCDPDRSRVTFPLAATRSLEVGTHHLGADGNAPVGPHRGAPLGSGQRAVGCRNQRLGAAVTSSVADQLRRSGKC